MVSNFIVPISIYTSRVLSNAKIYSAEMLAQALPSARRRKDIPVVVAEFATKAVSKKIEAFSLCHGLYKGVGADILTVRLQFNSTLFIFLANPADPEVLRLMNTWEELKVMGVLASDRSGRAGLQYAPFSLSSAVRESLAKNKQTAQSIGDFQDALAAQLQTGQLFETATSDIKTFPHLTEVNVALLTTTYFYPGEGFSPIPSPC
jgi:hypothetical protein